MKHLIRKPWHRGAKALFEILQTTVQRFKPLLDYTRSCPMDGSQPPGVGFFTMATADSAADGALGPFAEGQILP
jgi:hypothetical protein